MDFPSPLLHLHRIIPKDNLLCLTTHAPGLVIDIDQPHLVKLLQSDSNSILDVIAESESSRERWAIW